MEPMAHRDQFSGADIQCFIHASAFWRWDVLSQKRAADTLEAFALLQGLNHADDCSMVMVGDGPLLVVQIKLGLSISVPRCSFPDAMVM